MTLIEPVPVREQLIAESPNHRRPKSWQRSARFQDDPWDEWIMLFVEEYRGLAVPFMTVVNSLVKRCRAQPRLERERVKVEIIKRIGALIRQGAICRYKRTYVRPLRSEETELKFPDLGNLEPVSVTQEWLGVQRRS